MRVLVKRIFVRYQLNTGRSLFHRHHHHAMSFIIIGLGMILQTSGFDLSAFGIVFGALGIGIGFGLQNISNNFISGIIILFERPVKVGDRVEVDGVAGSILAHLGRAPPPSSPTMISPSSSPMPTSSTRR
jgi:small-conductance mechanosensitive channel